ncbi:MAG: S1C family serine protease [Gammaproteobacteria bacterium]|nr:S1C family serine protease [Gammaproteobacteria bacterium]MDH3468595.1 S1C family serine protease [Gammaproteobacteria bacterium]
MRSAPFIIRNLRYPLMTLLLYLLSMTAGVAQSTALEALAAVVSLRAEVPADARTAEALGTFRAGSGVVIDADGLILTIGYLILEADRVQVSSRDGDFVDASIVAYDSATGFGLVRADSALELAPIELGESAALSVGDSVLAVGGHGPQPIVPARVVSRRTYPGYWEYLLENAILTAPPHPQFGGAALLDVYGRLVGIGSLVIQDVEEAGVYMPGNMFVPIDALKPILRDLLDSGRTRTPPRPWLGVYVSELRGHVIINNVAAGGPADSAGVRANDIIVSVAGESVDGLVDFYRKLWAVGDAGVKISLGILRDGEVASVSVPSADRYKWLKLGPHKALSI